MKSPTLLELSCRKQRGTNLHSNGNPLYLNYTSVSPEDHEAKFPYTSNTLLKNKFTILARITFYWPRRSQSKTPHQTSNTVHSSFPYNNETQLSTLLQTNFSLYANITKQLLNLLERHFGLAMKITRNKFATPLKSTSVTKSYNKLKFKNTSM